MEHVVVNGELMRKELAQLPVMDRGILWGESLSESVLLRNSLPFRLEAHIDLLARSLRLPEIGILHALSCRRLERDIATLASRSKIYNGIVRIIVTPGCAEVSEECSILLPQGINEIVLLDEPLYSEKKLCEGLRLGYACYRQVRGDLLASFRIGMGMREHVALRKVIAEGYDEAVVCDEEGALISTTRANIFAVVDGGVITPHPVRDGVVCDVMRDVVLETLAREGIVLYQERLTEDIVEKATELFICSTTLRGVVKVCALGERELTEHKMSDKIIAAVSMRIAAELPAL